MKSRLMALDMILFSLSLPLLLHAQEKNCVLLYDFDQITETSKIVQDLSGNHNDGKLEGVDITSGVDGKGIYMNGNSCITIPTSNTLHQFSAMSFELWLAPEDPRGFGGILWASSNPDPEQQDTAPLLFGQWTWRFGFYLHTPDGQRRVITPYTTPARYDLEVFTYPKPAWHHVVITYDGKTSVLYVNGKQTTRSAWSEAKPLATITDRLVIGKMATKPLGLGSGLPLGFKGRMDRVSLYNVALSPEEVAAHYALREGFHPAREKAKTRQGTIEGQSYVPFNWGNYTSWKGFLLKEGSPSSASYEAQIGNTGEVYLVARKGRSDLLGIFSLSGQGGREDFYKSVDALLRITPPGKEKSLTLKGTTYNDAEVKQTVLITPEHEVKFRYEVTIPREGSGMNPVIPFSIGVGWFDARRFTGYEGTQLVKGRFVDLDRTVCFSNTVELYGRMGVRSVLRLAPGIVWEVRGHRNPMEFASGIASFAGTISRKLDSKRTQYPYTEILEYSLQPVDDFLPPLLNDDTATEITPDRPIDLSQVQTCVMNDLRLLPKGREVPIFGIDENVCLVATMPHADLSKLAGTEYIITVKDAYSEKAIHQLKDVIPARYWDWVGEISFLPPKPSVYIATLTFIDKRGTTIKNVRAEVAVTGPIEQPELKRGESVKLQLVDQVDFTLPDPGHHFYSYSQKGSLVKKEGVNYRSTLSLQEMRKLMNTTNRDWLGCTLTMKHPDRDHVVEVIFADLDDTIIGINVVEPVAQEGEDSKIALTRVSTGIITGGVFKSDGKLHSFKTVYMPTGRSSWCGVTCANQCEKAIGIARINLYEISGGLPKLSKMNNDRLVGVYTEGGNITLGTFGYNELAGEFIKDVPRERFYTENYRAIANLIRYMRYRGENIYNYGAHRYNRACFPSKYAGYPAQTRKEYLREYRFDLDQPALIAKMFEYNDLKLILNVQTSGNLAMTRLFRYSTYDLVRGAPETRQVSCEGEITNGYWTFTLANPFNPAVQREYQRLAEELGERYGKYRAVVGLSWLHGVGGLGEPCVYQWAWALKKENTKGLDRVFFAYTYDDLTMAQFEKYATVKLPGKIGDPNRFRERYEWIMKNAREQWIDFRCWTMAEIHKGLQASFSKYAPGRKYFVLDHGYGGTMMANEVPIERLMDFARLSCSDPKYYQGIPNLLYCPYVPQLDGSQCRINGHGGLSMEGILQVGRYARDEEFYTACDTGIDCGRYLHRQFFETFTIANAEHPWILTGCDHLRGRAHVLSHNTYPQPNGQNFFADFVRMFAYATPSFISTMWCDGSYPSGHEEEMQDFIQAYRKLPLGLFKTVKKDNGIYVRKSQDAFYVVETEGKASHCMLDGELVSGRFHNAVTGADMNIDAKRNCDLFMKPYEFRVYVKEGVKE